MQKIIGAEINNIPYSSNKPVFIKSLEHAVNLAVERIESEFSESLATNLVNGMLQRVNQQNHKQTADAVNQTIGVDVSQIVYSSKEISEELEAATLQNINLIKSVQSEHLDKVKNVVVNAAMNGERHESIVKEIARVGHVAERRAKVIARDQVNKINGALTQARQNKLGITEYIWSTSKDQRVRHEHAERDGKIFKWNEPPPDGPPGQAINCRCVAIPVINFD